MPPGGMGVARVRLAEPLADGGGRVLVVPWCRPSGSGMTMSFRVTRCGVLWCRRRAAPALTGAEQGGCLLRLLTGGGGCLLRLLTGGGCRGLCQPTGHLPDAAPADRVAVVAVAGLWPGHWRRRAVIVKPCQCELVGGLDVAGAEGAHGCHRPGIRAVPGPASRLALRADGFHRMPDTPSTRRAMSAMSATAMMIR